MPRPVIRALLLALSATAALVLAACGSSTSGHAGAATVDNGKGGHRGGSLTLLTSQDVASLDPGITYASLDLNLLAATERALYAYAPEDPTNLVPDLAAGPPQISADGKTLTVRIRSGVHFGPPVNREVTSRDVKYAIERGFNPHVANPYASTYYGDLVGAARASGGPIAGLQTPDDHTLVFKLVRPTASLVAQATVLPLSAPVPPEYAKPFDARAPSDYGNHVVATGPYMLAADSKGKVLGTGYVPGRSIRLVRNPKWSAATDARPAYLDAIEWRIGESPNVAGRQVLAGKGLALSDPPTPALVKRAYQQSRDQIFFSPGAGSRYAALNTAIPPFNDANLRKAVAAALDREQMRRVRGGEVIGDVASHFLYPGVLGFEQAGGSKGTGVDFLANPTGDRAVALKYMKAAGYPSGKYTGGAKLQVVGLAGAPDSNDAEIVNQTLQDLGFKTNLKLVESSVMYARFCALPRARVNVCPNVGWVRDFADPQTVLDLAFNGKYILPENNPNWPQLNDPTVNAAIGRAELAVGNDARASAWADVDRKVTATGAAIPWLWDRQPNIWSADVRCVPQLWNLGHCDLVYSSLK
ncbi:MAG TPA: ABC transporter substrate-binding protein [Conexibacter sp.]|jgi:peptide/nickel transport system substrate-binding protein|nr:ABC transporter substrate-binding protein [Conexibacter sp.]